ncbi:glycosyl hydrolase family 65 protein [Lactiplantibacillus plantarum]|nr:glycosyl hydrolase family 65 protein [Lactiplantibacillus plantarum]
MSGLIRRVRNGELHYAPFLPKKWQSYQFRQLFRGRLIEVTVDQSGTKFDLLDGDPITVDLDGKKEELIDSKKGKSGKLLFAWLKESG